MGQRNSEIIICKNIKLEKSYSDVLDYNEGQMVALCRQHAVATANNYSFIRKERNVIDTRFSYEDALKCNYMAFKNTDYSNKWFFAWIDEVIFKGDLNTEIKYTIDSWSTWFDKWTKKPCFIQREHTNDDTIGANTLQENLDIGDVIEEDSVYDISLSEYNWVAVETSWILAENSDGNEVLEKNRGKQFSGITVYNKQVFGNKIILFPYNYTSDLLKLALYILRTNSDGHIADIKNIFIIPDALINKSELILHTAYVEEKTDNFKIDFYELPMSDDVKRLPIEINKINSFKNLNIKNSKCFCYPYNYLYVSNNVGNSNIYKYENFYDSLKATFEIILSISIGCSGKLIPTNYKKISKNYDESLPLAKFPTCSWSSDAFINWLTQNAVNEASNMAFGIFGAGNQYRSDIEQVSRHNQAVQERGKGQEMTTLGADIGLGVNIAGTVARQIGNFYSGSLMPNIQGGQNTGDVTWADNANTFMIRCMRVKDENIKIIDEYFSRFGYLTNRVKLPNITGRQNFNYIEIGSSEEIGYGEVPSVFMNNINNACRRGVTIWHNHENLGNYNIENNII